MKIVYGFYCILSVISILMTSKTVKKHIRSLVGSISRIIFFQIFINHKQQCQLMLTYVYIVRPVGTIIIMIASRNIALHFADAVSVKNASQISSYFVFNKISIYHTDVNISLIGTTIPHLHLIDTNL